MPYQVTVNPEKCSGCEECLEACTVGVFQMEEGRSVPAKAEACMGCESCLQICKQEAIAVKNLEQNLSDTAYALLKDIL